MKHTFCLFALLATFVGFAQSDDEKEEPKQGWTKTGKATLLFNQSSFSDSWQAGGTSSLSGNLDLNYDFNYLKDDITWDNKLLFTYGRTKIKGNDAEKTNDRIEYNSVLGKNASGNWFYSAFFNFKTQMDVGYVEDENGVDVRTSHFFSPAFFQIGPGMLWKKSDNLKVNFAPATSKLIVVHDEFTVDGDSFGVEQGKTTRFEFGASIGAYAKFEIMKNVSFENILNLYSNYLEDPQNVDIDYTGNIVMTINKYLSANFEFQAIYDDNAVTELQTRQVFGLGVNATF
ncbi:DUF3078 domain-containing protein [Sediminicola luteus]|uniref:DUF3078 domain-containing protein n=1 Tax=Sediminicola luteus TaxID=319238 RepID=A0A2A4GDI6_9FLAO|nr:DUF3078 domain-containing protein [Sediminicola luteus]PCE66481.1 hypothetical protein B7P33_04075 [Sediminicola luteus]